MITVSDAIMFLRKNKICKRWTDQQLREAIVKSIYNNAVAYETDANDMLVSFCFGEWKSKEEFHVTAVAGKGKIKNLVKHLKTTFPECTKVTGIRREIRPRQFDVVKLLEKI